MSLTLGALLLHATPVPAADEAGKFAMKGAGFLPCRVYVGERAKKSNVYYMVGGWIEGFVSAHNKYNGDTYDVMSFESLELLLRLIESHCESNPDDRLHQVLGALIGQIGAQRLTKESPRVEIAEGERRTRLYRETISRMQSELTRLGLYKGAIDGRFTDATRSAVMAYQSDIGFETTGFPDQATLWRLFRGRAR